MKLALVKRVPAFAILGIAMAWTGYRVQMAAMRPHAPIAAAGDGARAIGSRAQPVLAARQSSRLAALPAALGDAAGTVPTIRSTKLAELRPPLSVDSARNPFAASSWLPPLPEVPPAPAVRPAPPTPPPLPFAYVGGLDQKAAKPRAFLSNADQLLIVSPGDVVDGQYRVESISDTDVVLTYLPLNQRQVIAVPSEGK
ncbi:hypothetical protein WS62_31875 [Burkholderia sp. ABCPW 14]|uniref:hypothetical protein n=1 Tax=Burkholderia sp. ABCPW 14 TaxID=1637860 RepID=UPI000770CA5D|nr:hypothetical protein [Burkholderia sp. ABCPW 14]KVD76338.1 hypothetical protein WS62_31875 [Burkholderia sp. ABCPW 14]